MSTPYRTGARPEVASAPETFVYALNAGVSPMLRWLGGEECDVLLRITDDSLVMRERAIPCAEIRALSLEHQTKPYAGHPTAHYPGFEGTGFHGTLDVARIVLELASGEAVPLTEDFFESEETAQWMGKIRLWLRSHRWRPEDEE